jgi:hypothetical protein
LGARFYDPVLGRFIIRDEEASRAYVEDIVGAATGKASFISKEAMGAYYTVKSGLLGIGSTLDSWLSGDKKNTDKKK